MLALLTNKWTWRAASVVVLGLLVAVALGKAFNAGYGTAAAKYQAEIAEIQRATAQADADELRRQTIANNAAKKREAEAIAQLEAEQASNDELRRKLASEARQDPDADRPVLGAGSVQRINQIR
ncbi:hypothetical protein G6N76_09820 [Rhizobium daejeonense]|uniref:Uncharacterized protein n=1 Tax=Rhizobium daejeonense TaxID=240521 RepID=A0A6M1S149_9HYPH|nr:hypothetical protein [Rhizobium daejeonense]NGO63971.1 hypothetical protein [Rhizobium daejeonense]